MKNWNAIFIPFHYQVMALCACLVDMCGAFLMINQPKDFTLVQQLFHHNKSQETFQKSDKNAPQAV